MKRISIVLALLFLCALTASAIGPRSPGGSGGSTFTGGTLAQNLTMSDGTTIELATGTSSFPAFRFRTSPANGIYSPAAGEMTINVADNFRVSIGGVGRWWLAAAYGLYTTLPIYSSNAMGFYLSTSAVSGTLPVFSYTSDNDSGLGRQAVGKPSLISDGVECIRVASSGTQIFQNLTIGAQDALYMTSGAGTPASFTGGAVTRLAWGSESVVGTSMTNSGYGIKAAATGTYLITCDLYLLASSDATYRILRLYKNDGGTPGGGTIVAEYGSNGLENYIRTFSVTFLGRLNANDTVTPHVAHNGSTMAGSVSVSNFSAIRLW